MSSDIVTNQISKDVLSSSSVAKSTSTNVSQVDSRQDVAAQAANLEGKALPPETKKRK